MVKIQSATPEQILQREAEQKASGIESLSTDFLEDNQECLQEQNKENQPLKRRATVTGLSRKELRQLQKPTAQPTPPKSLHNKRPGKKSKMAKLSTYFEAERRQRAEDACSTASSADYSFCSSRKRNRKTDSKLYRNYHLVPPKFASPTVEVTKYQPWKPMPHSCSQCSEKTTSATFRRRCIGVHENPCENYHPTLMRPGRENSCQSCLIEKEALWKSVKVLSDLANERDKLIDEESYGSAKQVQKRLDQAYVKESGRLMKTAQETKKRYLGYVDWMNKTGRS